MLVTCDVARIVSKITRLIISTYILIMLLTMHTFANGMQQLSYGLKQGATKQTVFDDLQ